MKASTPHRTLSLRILFSLAAIVGCAVIAQNISMEPVAAQSGPGVCDTVHGDTE